MMATHYLELHHLRCACELARRVANGHDGDAWDLTPQLRHTHSTCIIGCIAKLAAGCRPDRRPAKERGLLKDTIVLAIGEFAEAPSLRQHQRQRQRPRGPDPLAVTATPALWPAAASPAARSTQERQNRQQPPRGRRPPDAKLLATVYHAMGITPTQLGPQPPRPAKGNWCRPSRCEALYVDALVADENCHRPERNDHGDTEARRCAVPLRRLD